MLITTKVRLTKKDEKDKDKEITEYTECLINSNHILSVFPSGVNGVLIMFMVGGVQYLVKDEYKKLIKAIN